MAEESHIDEADEAKRMERMRMKVKLSDVGKEEKLQKFDDFTLEFKIDIFFRLLTSKSGFQVIKKQFFDSFFEKIRNY